ncbi:hypothetical protein [Silvimonas soli]|uniref:hypothetical protein n=1 Tax=Silvimonas soli TaxID=2980100 RepID=UPI0024B3B2D8|nr:hypothetical protein [Silvimonas soli]
MTMLNKTDLLGSKIKTKVVRVKALGGDITVREMSALDTDNYLALLRKPETLASTRNFMFVRASTMTTTGTPFLDDEDELAFSQMPQRVIDALVGVITETFEEFRGEGGTKAKKG